MTCEYYKKENGKCGLSTNLYCGRKSSWGYCKSNGILDRDDPV